MRRFLLRHAFTPWEPDGVDYADGEFLMVERADITMLGRLIGEKRLIRWWLEEGITDTIEFFEVSNR